VNRNSERDAIAEDVDAAITFGVFLASFLIGCAALALYFNGFTVSGISLGVVALIVPTFQLSVMHGGGSAAPGKQVPNEYIDRSACAI